MMEGDSETLFEKFLAENNETYPDEVTDIFDRMEIAGNETGILFESFDSTSSRVVEDICTFKDIPGRFLRLFFICYGGSCIVLGSGGEKKKHYIKRQEVQKLNDEMELLEGISLTLQEAKKRGSFKIDEEGYINGNVDLIFNYDDI